MTNVNIEFRVKMDFEDSSKAPLANVEIRRPYTSEHPERKSTLVFRMENEFVDEVAILAVANAYITEVGGMALTARGLLPTLTSEDNLIYSSMEIETDAIHQPVALFEVLNHPDAAHLYGYHNRSHNLVSRKKDEEQQFRIDTTNDGFAEILVSTPKGVMVYCTNTSFGMSEEDYSAIDKDLANCAIYQLGNIT